MTDKDRCPKCKGWYVYAEHSLYTEKWRIYCQTCGLSTELYDTWRGARLEWDKERGYGEKKKRYKIQDNI